MNKKNLYPILVIILFVGSLSIIYNLPFVKKASQTFAPSPTIAIKKISVYQKLNLGPTGSENFAKIDIEEGKTALDLLKKTASVKTNGEGANAFITEINGREAKATAKEFWAFYVNGKQAEVGAGSYKLKMGDKIEWKIENY